MSTTSAFNELKASPRTLRMVEFQLEDVFLVLFILNVDRKPNVVEFFILGPSVARMTLSRMTKRMVGSSITTTTPESRTDQYKEACTGTSERKRSQLLSSSPESGPHLYLAQFSDFLFFLAVSRPDSGNHNERDGVCTDNKKPHAHTRTLSRCARSHARCDHTFGSRA